MIKNKSEFGEGPIFTISNYIFYLLMANIYFILFNIPIIFILITIFANGSNPAPEGFSIIIFICCIPIGPAATALFSVMGKLVREKDISIFNDYLKAYKSNFLQAVILWSIELSLIMVLFVIARFLSSRDFSYMIVMFYYWLILLVFIIGLYMLSILSRFKMKSVDIIKISLYYCVRKVHITLLIIGFLIIDVFLFNKLFIFSLLIIPSITFFLIMIINKNFLLEIQEKCII